MPEWPELEIYVERLDEALAGATVDAARLHDPFALRTVAPPLDAIVGATYEAAARRGKHLLLHFRDAPSLAIHLMLAGRLHLKPAAKFKPAKRRTRVALHFDCDLVLEMTEAGTKRRATLRVLDPAAEWPEDLARGIEPFDDTLNAARFHELLAGENRQIKNALRDPKVVSGIGNAYSDEILHAAGLSPLKMTSRLTDDEWETLFASVRRVLREWADEIREACPAGLPVKQPDWRAHMAVHGRTGHACPTCGDTVAVVSFASSDTNYCPTCQTGGKLLADRRMSRFGVRRPPTRKDD